MRLSKKGWLVLSTLAIIGLGFAFYFLVYVQQREADIIAEKMRVLAQIKANIGLLIKNEGEIALNQKEGMILEHPVLSQVPQLIAQKNKGTGEWEQINQAIKKDFPGWTFDTSSQNGFQAREDSATWLDNNMAYRKSYSDFFGKELILRKDNFESVAIVSLGENSGSTLFTNHPSGNISFGDSTVARIQSKSMFEWDSGDDRYIVFTNFLREQGKNQIYLLGFVKGSELRRQAQEVSVFTVTTALILVTLMILGLPLLKLQVMSSAERLGAKDVFLAGASLVVGPMVLILFYLLFTTNIFTDKENEREKLETLNRQLAGNFRSEISDALAQLNIVKAQVDDSLTFPLKHEKIAKALGKTLKETFSREDRQIIFNNFWLHPFCRDNFPYFNSIFWATNRGEVAVYLSSEKDPQRINSLSHRNYVMDIIRHQGILFRGDTLKKDTIAFESIRSVTDGNYELGLGIPSGNPAYPLLATSFSSISMMDPVLEAGYGFCFFNTEGRTLFHSDIQRNLNENFLEETGGMLVPYVRSGQPAFVSLRYMGVDHYVYVQQVGELEGHFIATFLDKSYSYSPNAMALNTTAEMEIAFLILLLLIYLPLFAATRKKRKLQQKSFVLYWLRPLSGEQATVYNKTLLVNTIILIYLLLSVILYLYISYLPALLVLSVVLAGLSLVVTNFFLISRSFPATELVSTQYDKGGTLKRFWSITAAYLILWIMAKLLIIHPHYELIRLWDILILMVGMAAYVYQGTITGGQSLWKKFNQPIFGSGKEYLNYKIYCTSLILLLSIIPTLIFFSINYRIEQEILFKQKAHSLVEQRANWRQVKSAPLIQKRKEVLEPTVDSLDKFIDLMEKAADKQQSLTDGFSIDSLSCYEVEAIKLATSNSENSRNKEGWYDQMRVEFDKYGINSTGYIDKGNAAPWYSDHQAAYFPNASPAQKVTASIGSFQTLFVSNWWGMVLFLAMLVLLAYILIGLVAEKIYGLDFKAYAAMIRPRHPIEISKKLIEAYQAADRLNDTYNNSFIVGVNASHIYQIYHQLKEWKGDEFYSVELLDLPNLMEECRDPNRLAMVEYFANETLNFQIPIRRLIKNAHGNYAPLLDALNDKHVRNNKPPLMVYIEHFEYAYDDDTLSSIKLNLLQRLVSNPSIRVIVSSEISPTKFFEFYEERIKKASTVGSASLENLEKINGLKSTFKQWQHLLGGFYRITIPLHLEQTASSQEPELNHGEYLNRIKIKYAVLFGKKFTGDDNHILNVQETSFTYYFAIWNSLTKEERYIIYDIAHDRFINANNIDGIIDLLHKGILVYDHSLHLMNESFTNFVFTKVSSDEALERELESNKKGNWSTASAVLILLIISLITFISFGRVNILQDVNALLTSLAAIIAVFLRLGGMFVTGKSKE